MLKNKHCQILIVEDEEAIRDMLRLSLERESYRVLDCETAEEAIVLLHKENVDLILLDWMLPQMSGVEFIKVLREHEKFSPIPVIMLTAKAEETDKLSGFEAGVDDYICKPFSLKEMLARIQSVLRRTQSANTSKNLLSSSGIILDKDSHLVCTENNDEISLGPTEFKILSFLMENPERVYSREQLLDNVWGVGVYVDERTVDVHIRRLRKALSEYQLDKVIRTVRGSGYSFTQSRKK